MPKQDLVVLVDYNGHRLLNPDGAVCTMDKMQVHQRGVPHLAVSVFIFNNKDELLLQRRAMGKYHSSGKWTNTCCTHPRPGETPLGTARRRLTQEMGLECELKEAFAFSYKVDVGSGLIENEFDHVFVGFSNQDPEPDPNEVCGWRWISIEDLKQEMVVHPDVFSAWIHLCLPDVIKHLRLI
jgi:isopentenyl-diphosphate Delta-isomerase